MSMQNSKNAYKTFQAIIHVLGDTFPMSTLVDFTELSRRKPLRIEQDNMPVGMSGYCIALSDVDLICTRRGLDPILLETTLLHEIAHLLLNHIPLVYAGSATVDYATFILSRNTSSALKRIHAVSSTAQQELEAEALATLLLECITKDRASVPDIARHLGW